MNSIIGKSVYAVPLLCACVAAAILPQCSSATCRDREMLDRKSAYAYVSGAAISTDGMKIAVTLGRGHIYTSNDGGATWAVKESGGARAWLYIASSADGTRLAAAAHDDDIYVSGDAGTTWTGCNMKGERRWTGLVVSSDGMKLAARYRDGSLCVSPDGGKSWTGKASRYRGFASKISASSDLTRMAVISTDSLYSGYVITSRDGGNTWTMCDELNRPVKKQWSAVTSSADGMKLAAAAYEAYTSGLFNDTLSPADGIYTSGDGGKSWRECKAAGKRYWKALASSSDGMRLTAIDRDGEVYSSKDGGKGWSRISSLGGNIGELVSSSDGLKLAACFRLSREKNDIITISRDGGRTWVMKVIVTCDK